MCVCVYPVGMPAEVFDMPFSPPEGSLHRGGHAQNRQTFSSCQRGLLSYVSVPQPSVNRNTLKWNGQNNVSLLYIFKGIIMFFQLQKERITSNQTETFISSWSKSIKKSRLCREQDNN